MTRVRPASVQLKEGKKKANNINIKKGRVNKTDQKKKKHIVLKGANAWRDEDNRSKEEIAQENFENRKLYKINDKGEKIKEFAKQGAVRPWIDLKYEENERVSYYDGFFIKKEAVEQLDKLKQQMEFDGVDKFTVKRKMMKAVRKAKWELFKEMLYEEKLKQIKEGTYKGPVKVWNKRKGKNCDESAISSNKNKTDKSHDATLEINGVAAKSKTSAKTATLSLKCDTIEGLDLNYEYGSISDEGNPAAHADNDDANDTLMEFNGIPYKIVDTNLNDIDESDDTNFDSHDKIDSGNTESPDENTEKISPVTDKEQKKSLQKDSPLVFEENKLMTCVEGFWVRRSCLFDVDKLRAAKRREIMAARSDNRDDPLLSKLEEKQYQIKMKFELNKRANKLRAFLKKKAKNKSVRAATTISNPTKPSIKKQMENTRERRTRLFRGGFSSDCHSSAGRWNREERPQQWQQSRRDPGFRDAMSRRPMRNEGNAASGNLVRFDGYWIKKDAAERLKKLKGELQQEGVPSERIAEIMKTERRREENEIKHERKTVCFSCRKPGHVVADCPLKQNTAGVGACFKCGSLEHQSGSCTKGGSYSFATCFVCGKTGHISRECPNNTRGLYPDGGGCTLCDSNQHLIKDCPRNAGESRNERMEVTAEEFRPGQLLEVEVDGSAPASRATTDKKSKHIRF